MIKNLGSVEGFEEYSMYSVTSNGNIVSHRGKVDRILKQAELNGYLVIGMSVDNKSKNFYVHRLVAKAFVSGYRDDLEVNHIDENKWNNKYFNLEWVTHQQNVNHGKCIERGIATRSKAVMQKTLDGVIVKIWKSPTKADKIAGFNRNAIYNVVNGKANTHGGYQWKYLNESELME